jgi:hypothetical protein
MGKSHTKFLLTEGKDDVHSIVGLMSNHVEWGTTKDQWPVKIESAGSVGELLNDTYISTYLKSSGLEALGVVLDANDSFEGRWERVQQLLRPKFPSIPKTMDPEGVIIKSDSGLRLGVWIMPDNCSRGMLETFLAYLVPDESQAVWQEATNASERAREAGAPFKGCHADKARIHTWLAWQNPPGRPFGVALKAKWLDPSVPQAEVFARWFTTLYGL